MRSLSSLIVIATSFVSLAFAGSFKPTPSSRFAKGPLSSRQFQYPRGLFDTCSDIDLALVLESVIGVNLGNLGDICLCLSGFPLDLDLYTNLQVPASLLGGTALNSLLQKTVRHDVLLLISQILTVSSKGQRRRCQVHLPQSRLPRV